MPWDDDINPDKDEQTTVEIGKPLPIWSEGYLDIHFINTGRGECCYYILPDGTTLLVDAGELPLNYGDGPCPQRPNSVIRPYETYAKYIKHFMPQGNSAIDYCAPSHFHIDHIGSKDAATETSPVGYRKSGLLALFDLVAYKHILDNAYPGYKEDSVTPALDGELAEDWGKFVTWGVKEGKFTGARFTPGEEQIVLLNKRDNYKNFKVFNICANGRIWQKNDDGSSYVKKITLDPANGNNPSSCGFHLSYGNFDYIACGDLTSGPQNQVAYYVRDFIGKGHFDAFKCHHHLASNAWGTQMRADNNFFEPRVIVNNSLFSKHCNPELLNTYIMGESWDKDFFATNLHPKYISANSALVNKFSGYNGHIVIRVKPGGGEYNVYMLDDTNFEYKIKSIHGPYTSK